MTLNSNIMWKGGHNPFSLKNTEYSTLFWKTAIGRGKKHFHRQDDFWIGFQGWTGVWGIAWRWLVSEISESQDQVPSWGSEAPKLVCEHKSHGCCSVLSCVRLFLTPWTAARQTSLSFTVSQSLVKLMSIESVMPSNHLILCCPLLLLPSIFPSIRVFSNELALPIRWLPLESQLQRQPFQWILSWFPLRMTGLINYMGIVSKCKFWFSESGMKSETLSF